VALPRFTYTRPGRMDTDTQFLLPTSLRCDRCGWVRDCTPADLRVYAAIGPPACCGRPLTLPALTPIPAAEPRAERRRSARPGAAVEVRRAGDRGAPDLAAGLVDLARDGLGARVEAPIPPGEPVEVVVRAPGAARAVPRAGEVRWCRPLGGGLYLVGIRLARPLATADVDALVR
jgi:hypothetical protein